MKRYCTYSDYDDNVFIINEGQKAINTIPDDAADWVWQFAQNAGEAKATHFEKYDRLTAILNAGLPMPKTIGN